MTTVADLPSSAKLIPQSWGFNMTGSSREHSITWYVNSYADFLTFYQKVLYTTGTIEVSPGPPAVTVTRVIPLICPTDPDLVALSIRNGSPPQPNQRGNSDAGGPWESVTVDGRTFYQPRAAKPPWEKIFLTVNFGIPPYQTSGDRPFMDITEEDRIERRTVPNHPYELIDDMGDHVEWVAQDIGLPAGTSLFRLTWHELSDLPAAQAVFQPILDKVNDDDLTIPFIGADCPRGTLHCSSKSSSVSVSFGNNKKSTLSVTLAQFPGGWNRAVASADTFAGQLLRINPRPIQEADYGPIFNPTV